MAKTRWSILIAVAALASQTACFTTRIVTDKRPETRAFEHEDRQWFTIGGLVPLSGPAGRECEHGLSYAESKMGGIDILINIGLSVAGTLVGASACTSGTEAERFSCATSAGTLVPFLLGSRTVTYTCAAAPSARDLAPAAPGAPPPPSALPPPPPSAPTP
ncbi:MAG: hypothetical protein JXB05_36030 [Myxococcaceae bacterium]|nr:hypothetical protein [Myxococcaceae bacterium]